MFLVPEKYDETVSNLLQVYMYQYKMWNSKEYTFPTHQRSPVGNSDGLGSSKAKGKELSQIKYEVELGFSVGERFQTKKTFH